MFFLVTTVAALALGSLGPEARTAGGVAPPDTLSEAHGWLSDLGVTVNLSQAAYGNWQEGGLNTLAAGAGANGQFARVLGDFRQRHDIRMALGVVRQDTLALRKAVDVIRYGLDLQYTGLGAWQPTFSSEIRTQFAAGHDYSPEPDRYPELEHLIVPGERLKVSDFFAPAFWTQSLGVAYEGGGWYRFRSGLGLKQTIVPIERLRPVYGNRPDEPVRIEAGLDGLVEAGGQLMENVRIRSRLSFFQAFTQIAESAPDLLWENTVQLRVNRWLSVNGEVVAMYDRDVLDRIQLKQVAGLGISIIVF